jgi:hypothetical protein
VTMKCDGKITIGRWSAGVCVGSEKSNSVSKTDRLMRWLGDIYSFAADRRLHLPLTFLEL